MVIQMWLFGRHFLESEYACCLKDSADSIWLPIILEIPSENQNFRKLVTAIVSLTASQYNSDFTDQIGSDINKYNFLIWFNGMY